MTLQNSVNSSYSVFSKPVEIKDFFWLNASFAYLSKGGTGCAIDAQEVLSPATCNVRLNSGSPTGLSRLSFDIGDTSNLPGGCILNIFQGNATASINHQLVGNGNSYLNAVAGNLGVGIVTALDKLHVVGFGRFTSGIRLGNTGFRITYDAAAPTTGTWIRGDIRYNTAPVASGFVGWVCVAAGTPGTWKTFGAISA